MTFAHIPLANSIVEQFPMGADKVFEIVVKRLELAVFKRITEKSLALIQDTEL